MIDHKTEKLEPFETAQIDGNPCLATRYRWVLKGALNRVTGVRVKLESILVGTKRFTSREAIDRFITALNATGPVASNDEVEITSGQRKRQNAAAKRALEKAGV